MKFRKDEALVLHSRKWSESSFILTCLARESGKLSLVSKGARRPKAFTGAYHTPGSHVELIWIDHSQRDLFSLVSIDPLVQVSVPLEYLRFTAWMRILRLVKRTINPESPHPTGYYQLIRTLQAIGSDKTDARLLYLQFVLRWVSELGFPIDWSRCDRCGNLVRGKRLAILVDRGVGICENCLTGKPTSPEEQLLQISGETYAWLRKLDAMSEREVKRITVSDRAREEMETVCMRYGEHHLGFSLRSVFQ